MRVKVTPEYCGTVEYSLHQFLSDEIGKVWGYGSGAVENIQEQTNSLKSAMARLIILLMEKDVISFDEIIKNITCIGDSKIELIKE